MVTKEKLKEILSQFPDARDVQVVGDNGVIATVVSGSFAGTDEADRQKRVWDHLRGKLSEDDLQSIEFVFTNAPGEEAAEKGA